MRKSDIEKAIALCRDAGCDKVTLPIAAVEDLLALIDWTAAQMPPPRSRPRLVEVRR